MENQRICKMIENICYSVNRSGSTLNNCQTDGILANQIYIGLISMLLKNNYPYKIINSDCNIEINGKIYIIKISELQQSFGERLSLFLPELCEKNEFQHQKKGGKLNNPANKRRKDINRNKKKEKENIKEVINVKSDMPADEIMSYMMDVEPVEEDETDVNNRNVENHDIKPLHIENSINYTDSQPYNNKKYSINVNNQVKKGKIIFENQTDTAGLSGEEKNFNWSLIHDKDVKITKIADIPTLKQETLNIHELGINICQIRFDSEPDRTYTLLTCPIDWKENITGNFIRTFTYATDGSSAKVYSSSDNQTSYPVKLGENCLIVNGFAEFGLFKTNIYPIMDQSIVIRKEYFIPKIQNVGHCVLNPDEQIQVHILPLSNKNSKKGNVGIAVCILDQKANVCTNGCSLSKPEVELVYKNIKYEISAKWNEKQILIPLIKRKEILR